MTDQAGATGSGIPYPHIPPHIREWMATEDGWQRVTEIVLDALDDTTNVVTNVEVRDLVEEAYRRRPRPDRPGAGGSL
jgi:hypothetical protein